MVILRKFKKITFLNENRENLGVQSYPCIFAIGEKRVVIFIFSMYKLQYEFIYDEVI